MKQLLSAIESKPAVVEADDSAAAAGGVQIPEFPEEVSAPLRSDPAGYRFALLTAVVAVRAGRL
jgi:hypothetical protein